MALPTAEVSPLRSPRFWLPQSVHSSLTQAGFDADVAASSSVRRLSSTFPAQDVEPTCWEPPTSQADPRGAPPFPCRNPFAE